MGIFDRSFWLAIALLIGASFAAPARSADYGYPPPPPEEFSVACDVGWAGWYTLLPAYWTSVWMAHFSGGVSYYNQALGVEELVWLDQKRCFPSYRACMTWVTSLRREYHRPEGYWTCMPLR